MTCCMLHVYFFYKLINRGFFEIWFPTFISSRKTLLLLALRLRVRHLHYFFFWHSFTADLMLLSATLQVHIPARPLPLPHFKAPPPALSMASYILLPNLKKKNSAAQLKISYVFNIWLHFSHFAMTSCCSFTKQSICCSFLKVLVLTV